MLSSTKAQFNRFWLGIFASILIALAGLVTSTLNVSAMNMDHTMAASQNCNISCNNVSYTPATLTTRQEEDDDLPTPPVTTPYFVQFQKIAFTQPTPPQNIILSSSYRPPDINRLESRFRF